LNTYENVHLKCTPLGHLPFQISKYAAGFLWCIKRYQLTVEQNAEVTDNIARLNVHAVERKDSA